MKTLETSLLATDRIFLRPKGRIFPDQDPDLRIVDVEFTNRCNARCYFCPRDRVENYGNMSLETFQAIVQQVKAMGEDFAIGACGHGDPLLHPQLLDLLRYGTEQGIRMYLTTNGLHLDRLDHEAFLATGIKRVYFSVSEIGEAYTAMYRIPWDTVIRNIRALVQRAAGRCEFRVQLVMTEKNEHRIEELRAFWQNEGITEVGCMPVGNRAGDIDYKAQRYADPDAIARANAIIAREGFSNQCFIAFGSPFVSWDGYHHLCCSDWSRQQRIAAVGDVSLKAVNRLKADVMAGSAPTICNACDLNIRNRLIDAFHAAPGKQDKIIARIIADRHREEAYDLRMIEEADAARRTDSAS